MSVIVGLVNRRNISLLVAIKKLNPSGVYLIHSGSKRDMYDLADISEFLNNTYPKLIIKDRRVDCYSCSAIVDTLEQIARVEKGDIVLDLSNGHPVAIAFLKEASHRKYPVFIFSERDNRAVMIENGSCSELTLKEVSFEVEDFIESGGGIVYHKSTAMFDSEEIAGILSWQVQNYPKWLRINRIIKDKALLKTFGENERETRVLLDMKNLNPKNKSLLLEYIYALHRFKLIKMDKQGKSRYFLNFKSLDFKHYVMTYGSWLEALTYSVVKHLKVMDDIESGVTLLWDKSDNPLSNEIDVMAAFKGRLVAISCKDSQRYDENTLHELELQAYKLGGTSAIKILVATSLPNKKMVVERANHMNIHLIVFDGNLNMFYKKFKQLFAKM
ncbi:hypothetical protein EAL2_808p06380 (plasmid) [Peptoclostridium acidaminophilum DSM 3953]|uniref:Card1 endonuclease domain-containing protein n=1 Tax=Peptoclostridium acidaminophilum DSM 3953 TaxID=1286171 RepID=W8UBP7_PEPAC|nr:DUF1887 family CARF protein [Peptoclostridium acidaminophilum]AHM58141.1 hypothetical protein EAL2_808p06380 [Peptoclostridium acidaminophilum DSM 3953]